MNSGAELEGQLRAAIKKAKELHSSGHEMSASSAARTAEELAVRTFTAYTKEQHHTNAEKVIRFMERARKAKIPGLDHAAPSFKSQIERFRKERFINLARQQAAPGTSLGPGSLKKYLVRPGPKQGHHLPTHRR
ncbi:MAG: hypothetical protein WCW13_06210 [archaeon]|jgi:hypothetical protein